ncbi:MAG: hypothetical protein RRY55_01175 [Bacteroidales bacterium]
MARFNRVEFSMRHSNTRGLYWIEATYRGRDIKVLTNDSEVFDWYDDNSDKAKHQEALRHCYNNIKRQYEGLCN